MKTILKVKDPHNHKRRYSNTRKSNLKNLFKEDVELITEYLSDMENGINVFSKKKGSRSYARLNALKSRIPTITGWVKERYKKRLTDLTMNETTELFNQLIKGNIKKSDGEPYKSSDDYVKDFKAFWHWYMLKKKREFNLLPEKERLKPNIRIKYMIEDITEEVPDNNDKKPKWHYFEPDYQKLRANAKWDYQVLMDFLMDTGLRFPTETLNVRVSDIKPIVEEPDKANLTIRKETSKTNDERTFKLMRCYPILKQFIESNNLKGNDFIFTKNTKVYNRYFKRLGFRVLGIGKKVFRNEGNGKSKPDVKDGITGYDFRHNSACYWLPRYPTQQGMMYRFGWKTTKQIEYYTEFLGMKDNIADDNLLIGTDRTELQREHEKLKQEKDLLEETVKTMSMDLEYIKEMLRERQIKKAVNKITT